MRFSALFAVPVALVGLAVPAYAEDPGLTVTWPATTEVAVPNTSYTFNVADTSAEPQGTLYAEWQGERLPAELPHAGDYTMNFAKGGTGTIKVVRCVPADPEPVCTDTGDVSPTITVWKAATLYLDPPDGVVPTGNRVLPFELPEAPNRALAVTVTLHGGGGPAIDTTATVNTDASGRGQIAYTIPATRSGNHYLRLRTSFDAEPFGPHRLDELLEGFYVDNAAPRLSIGQSSTSIYPAPDGYRDQVSITANTNEQVTYTLAVHNSAGTLVRKLSSGSMGYETSGDRTYATWKGRDSQGRLVRAGTYRIKLTGTDRAGRTTTSTKTIAVSSKRLQKATWKRTFTAGATVVRNGAFVQACSTLRKPSLRGWAGSLGYYSRTKCSRDNADIVSTTNGVYVPKAFQSKYHTYQVSFYGGGARGARNAYIVMGYLNNKNDFTHRIQGGAAVRSYAGKVASAGNFVHAKTTKPYVLWTAGLTDGSRYDVKSFTVRLTYTVLR